VDLAGLLSFREPAECAIRVRGREVTEVYPFLLEVTAQLSRAEASVLTLVFESRRDERGRWPVLDGDAFRPWEPITVEAVFGMRREEILRGFVREVRADYPADPAAARFTVECQDESLALDRRHERTAWGADVPAADAAIVADIASRNGLAVDPESGAGRTGVVTYQDSTDVRFLRERAEANGYELYVRRGLVYFGPMRLAAAPQPPLLVYAGSQTSCIQLSVRSDGHRPDAVALDVPAAQGDASTREVVAPDLPVLGTEPADSRGSGLPEFTWLLEGEPGASADELRARAQARANENALRVRGDGELDGSIYGHVLLPGLPVGVDGAGNRLDGTYYVDTVTHRFSADGYRQSFALLRNAYGDDLGAGGAASAIAGIL